MAGKSVSLDYWRKFFRSANSDIFEVIEQAIVVAAVDCPKEFRSRRDRIAEKLFTCKLSRCFGCNNVEIQIPYNGEELGEEEGGGSVKREVGEKGSKMDSCNGSAEDLKRVGLSNYSYDEAEALTDVMEEESQRVGEVLRIKEVLCNKLDESDSVLYESLRRLELMQLSVETLQATEIGKAVKGLRKHNKSKQIRNLIRTLIEGWKVLVDEWVTARAAIADHSPDSVNPSMLYEEEGLPSPPLDEGALLATQTTSIELSEFFDGMDDDGNFRTSGDFDNAKDTDRRFPQYGGPARRQDPPRKPAVVPADETQASKPGNVVQQAKPIAIPSAQWKPQSIVDKPIKPSTAGSGPGRPLKLSCELKPEAQSSIVQRKLCNGSVDRSKNGDEASDAKLEQAKRNLHERYQQVENAKRQRTIQVMEIHDLPKQSHNQRPSNMKPKSQLRNWANARR